MQADNFLIKNKVKFITNKGNFDHQPVFTAVQSNALTGDSFLSLCRVRKSTDDTVSGVMVLYLGVSGETYSITGTKEIYAQSTTANVASTADSLDYIFTTVMTNSDRLDVITEVDNAFFGDMSISGFNSLSALNYIGMGFRSIPDELPTGTTLGNNTVAYYTYNRQELSTSLTAVADRSGNEQNLSLKGQMMGDATTTTVTGWSYSPMDGGMRLDGASYMISPTSSLYNLVDSNSGWSAFTFAKLSVTGGNNIVSIGASASNMFTLRENNQALELVIGSNSFTAGNLNVGQWYHVGATFDGNPDSSNSGATIYINGVSAGTSAMIDVPTFNDDARLLIGADIDLATSSMTGVVGMTKIFNRRLTKPEMLQNYLATIPSMMILDTMSIA